MCREWGFRMSLATVRYLSFILCSYFISHPVPLFFISLHLKGFCHCSIFLLGTLVYVLFTESIPAGSRRCYSEHLVHVNSRSYRSFHALNTNTHSDDHWCSFRFDPPPSLAITLPKIQCYMKETYMRQPPYITYMTFPCSRSIQVELGKVEGFWNELQLLQQALAKYLNVGSLFQEKSVHSAAIFATPLGSSYKTKSYLNEWGNTEISKTAPWTHN